MIIELQPSNQTKIMLGGIHRNFQWQQIVDGLKFGENLRYPLFTLAT
jgi:hypothetical protein